MTHSPKVSVIIPVRNEEEYIAKCLQSVLANDYPKGKLEILVVDGMSEDHSRAIVKEYMSRYPNIKLLSNPRKITPTALNLGIKKARGDIIIILGGHGLVANDFIKKSVKYLLEKKEADCVGGPVMPIQEGNQSMTEKLIALSLNSAIGAGSFRFREHEGSVSTVSFGAYRKQTFSRYGKFDQRLVRTHDFELNYRILKNGGEIYMTPDIKSYYYPRNSLKSLWEQYFQYGFWKVKVMQKHKSILSKSNLAPPLLILGLLASLISSVFTQFGLFTLSFLSFFYILLTILFSLEASRQKNIKYTLLLPLVFWTIHLSFGFGFLKSLFIDTRGKFSLPWKGF